MDGVSASDGGIARIPHETETPQDRPGVADVGGVFGE